MDRRSLFCILINNLKDLYNFKFKCILDFQNMKRDESIVIAITDIYLL